MKAWLSRVYKTCVVYPEDGVLFFCAVGFFVAAVLVGAYDIWVTCSIAADRNLHIPWILPIGLFAFCLIIFKILTHKSGCEQCRRDRL